TLLNVPGTLAGKKIRCTKCERVLTAPAGSPPEPAKEAIAPRARGNKPAAPRSNPDDDDRADDSRWDDRSRGNARPKQRQRDKSESSGSLLGLWLGIAGGSFAIIVITIAVLIALTRSEPPPEPPLIVQQPMPKQVVPPWQIGGVVPIQPGMDVMPQ